MEINFEYYGCIYLLTCNINNKIYVGKTKMFGRRKNEYRNRRIHQSKKYNTPILRAINKYGFSNFTMIAIDFTENDKTLSYKERYYIELYDSTNPKVGYNSKPGDTGRLNHITRRKMSESHTGLTEAATTKRKKSIPIVAFKGNVVLYCDSSKILGDFIDSDRSVVNAAKLRKYPIKGWYVLPTTARVDEYKDNDRREYLEYARKVEEGVETIENIHYMVYE